MRKLPLSSIWNSFFQSSGQGAWLLTCLSLGAWSRTGSVLGRGTPTRGHGQGTDFIPERVTPPLVPACNSQSSLWPRVHSVLSAPTGSLSRPIWEPGWGTAVRPAPETNVGLEV